MLGSEGVAAVRDLKRLASEPATADELAGRRAAFQAIKRLRAEMTPIDLTVEELLSDDDGEGD